MLFMLDDDVIDRNHGDDDDINLRELMLTKSASDKDRRPTSSNSRCRIISMLDVIMSWLSKSFFEWL